MKFFLSILILLSSCSYKKNNQTLKGHEELYSEPELPKLSELSNDEKRIVIASTNDLHGNFEAIEHKFSDNHNNKDQSIQIGGENVMSTYFGILRDVYKNVLLVDSGDIFSSASNWKEVEKFYSDNKYDAVTVGLRDFNVKVPSLIGNNTKLFQEFSKSSEVPLLLSNLYELKTARVVEWKGTKSHLIKEVGGVKVGLIGIIPDDIVQETPVQNRVGLFVENMLQSTLRHARLLRSLGADMIVVMTHQGIDCSTGLSEVSKLPEAKVNFEPKRENICDLKNPLGEYLERLPRGLVDIVIGGRNSKKTANFVNDVLVVSSFPDGRSFSYNEFVINTKTKKLNREKTVVHQPVFFCNEFFKETDDCYFEDPSIDHKKRIPATFLGQPIFPEKTASRTEKELLKPNEVARSLVTFEADISYAPVSSGETQLFIMKIKGHELLKILEEEYNHGRQENWQPSPFLLKNNELTVSISGQEIDLNKTYRVLSDLESVQRHKVLVKKVTSYDSEALMNHSWLSIEDEPVKTQMAAQAH